MDPVSTEPTFETALARLESIVDSMESGDVPLADLLSKYEEGTRLLRVCEGQLKDAEMKIEALKVQSGSVELSPLPAARSGQ